MATRYNTPKKRILEVEMGITMAILFLANSGAHFFYWYSTIWWFDMPMHFTGGYFVAIALVYVLLKARKEKPLPTYLKLFFLVLTVGFLWEVYEYAFDIYFHNNLIMVLDSFSDLCFDMAGAITAFFFIDRHML